MNSHRGLHQLLSEKNLEALSNLVSDLETILKESHKLKIPKEFSELLSKTKTYLSLMRAFFVYAQSQYNIIDLKFKESDRESCTHVIGAIKEADGCMKLDY